MHVQLSCKFTSSQLHHIYATSYALFDHHDEYAICDQLQHAYAIDLVRHFDHQADYALLPWDDLLGKSNVSYIQHDQIAER